MSETRVWHIQHIFFPGRLHVELPVHLILSDEKYVIEYGFLCKAMKEVALLIQIILLRLCTPFSQHGKTCLHVAIEHDRLDVIRLLLER